MRVALLQSNYMPWRGYFDIIRKVDLFVFYDDVQYTTRDWRNRNKIKTPYGVKWITVPNDGTQRCLVNEVKLIKGWQQRHINQVTENYREASYFKEIMELLNAVYHKEWEYLSELNQYSIKLICEYLNIKTSFDNSERYNLTCIKEDRFLPMLEKLECQVYLSGQAAKNYIDENKFAERGIKLEWMEYDYLPYPQLHGEFINGLSIIDTLMNTNELSL